MATENEAVTVFNYGEKGLSFKHSIRTEAAILHLLEALRDEIVSGYSEAAVVEMEIRDAGLCVYLPSIVDRARTVSRLMAIEKHDRNVARVRRERHEWLIIHELIARRQPVGAPVRMASLGETLPTVYWITGIDPEHGFALIREDSYPLGNEGIASLCDLRPAYDQPLR